MHEAILWEPLALNGVRCRACPRGCVISEGKAGFCGARVNRKGALVSLVYGRVASAAWAEVERKPLFHFYPGEVMLSVGTLGCNFKCPGCQNWALAHADPGAALDQTEMVPPQELVARASKRNCIGISWTYNEPTVWIEYVLDGARLAREAGLLTNVVTNGGMSEEALDAIGPWVDAYRVDIKGFSEETYRRAANFPHPAAVRRAAARAKRKWRMHVECVTNVIPGHNDQESELRQIAAWIREALGAETPWHLTRFAPALRLCHVEPTPVARLESARQMATEMGLEFVYLGNVPGHPGENTYCPDCGSLLIRRCGFESELVKLRGNACTSCGTAIPGRFRV